MIVSIVHFLHSKGLAREKGKGSHKMQVQPLQVINTIAMTIVVVIAILQNLGMDSVDLRIVGTGLCISVLFFLTVDLWVTYRISRGDDD